MTYIKQIWNNDDPATPVEASRLNHVEQGIYDAHNSPVIQAKDAVTPSLVSRAIVGQTSNLQEWQSSGTSAGRWIDKAFGFWSSHVGMSEYVGGTLDGMAGGSAYLDKAKRWGAVTLLGGANGARGDSITSDTPLSGDSTTSMLGGETWNQVIAQKGGWTTWTSLLTAYEDQWTTLSAGITLPVATIPVTSTTVDPQGTAKTWPTSGTLNIGGQLVTYTGKTGSSFTGCAGGTGTFASGTNLTLQSSPSYQEAGAAVFATYNERQGALAYAIEAGVQIRPGKQARVHTILAGVTESNAYSTYASALGSSSGYARTGARGVDVLSAGSQYAGTAIYVQGGWRYSLLIDMPDPGFWAIVIGGSTDQVGKERFALRGDGVIEMGLGGSTARDTVALQRVGVNTVQLPTIQISNTWASNADAAVNGYVSVNVGGTVRKLATIA